MPGVMKDRGLADRVKKRGFIDLASDKRVRLRIHTDQSAELFDLGRFTVLRPETNDAVTARLDGSGQQQMRQVRADHDREILNKIFTLSGTPQNSKRQSMKRPIGNNDESAICVEKIGDRFDKPLPEVRQQRIEVYGVSEPAQNILHLRFDVAPWHGNGSHREEIFRNEPDQ